MADGVGSDIQQTIAQRYRILNLSVTTALTPIKELISAAAGVDGIGNGQVLEMIIHPVSTAAIITDGYTSTEKTLEADTDKVIPATGFYNSGKIKSSSGTITVQVELLMG
jgi:hypothetical protein